MREEEYERGRAVGARQQGEVVSVARRVHGGAFEHVVQHVERGERERVPSRFGAFASRGVVAHGVPTRRRRPRVGVGARRVGVGVSEFFQSHRRDDDGEPLRDRRFSDAVLTVGVVSHARVVRLERVEKSARAAVDVSLGRHQRFHLVRQRRFLRQPLSQKFKLHRKRVLEYRRVPQ